MVRLFYVFFVAFRYNINRAFLRFTENFRDILPHDSQTKELYAADKQNDANRRGPSRYAIPKAQRTHEYKQHCNHRNDCEKAMGKVIAESEKKVRKRLVAICKRYSLAA